MIVATTITYDENSEDSCQVLSSCMERCSGSSFVGFRQEAGVLSDRFIHVRLFALTLGWGDFRVGILKGCRKPLAVNMNVHIRGRNWLLLCC